MSLVPKTGPVPPGGNDPLLALRRGMDRLMEQFTGEWGLPAPFASPGVTSPRMDVAETPAGLELHADLPGIEAKDVAIEVEDGVLTIRAERVSEKREEDRERRWHLVERSSGTYLRRLALPFEPEAEKVEASFDKGVLRILIPRPQAAKPQAKRIEIKGG